MKEQLKFCLDGNGKVSGWACSPKKWENRPILLQELRQKHGNDLSIAELVTIEIEHNGVHPTCKTCSSKLRMKKRKFPLYCCVSCAQKNAATRDKMRKTWEKGGISHPLNSERAKQKRKQTNLEKYGVEHVLQSDVSHLREGMKRKYGVESARQLDHVNENVKKANIEKYGVNHYFQSEEFKGKAAKTFREKYGVDHSSKHRDIIAKAQDKRKQTLHDNFLASIPEKYKAYAVDMKCLYEALIKEGHDTSRKIEEELGVSQSWVSVNFRNFELKRNTPVSFEETRFVDDLEKKFDIVIARSNRSVLKSREIDAWISNDNLGIEYHGLYWHSSLSEPDLRVREKYELSRQNGVTLLQFWSSEVETKRNIVESIISAKLGKNRKIFARLCDIKLISARDYSKFCEENHLQGSANASVRIGLFHDGALVCIMSFSKSRFDKQSEWEMIRFCSISGTTIIGGASKLWKYFIKNYDPKSVVSYADVRISNGNLYETLGFSFCHISDPNYWYTKDCINLESRVKYQKHKLEKLLDTFDSSQTEKQNMINNGYRIVYDGGNLVYRWYHETVD